MASEHRHDGVVVQIIELGPRRFSWSMRKDDEAPFLHSLSCFGNAKHAEINARKVVTRASKKVAYVEQLLRHNERTALP